jgi:HD-GYP domain-containing protein (c-di-GMP phosphodiesterase class II)
MPSKLIPFAASLLRADDPLPFAVYDADGRMLVAAGQLIESVEKLKALAANNLLVDEAEAQDWNRRLVAAMDHAMRQGAALKDVAAARPEPAAKEPVAAAEQTLLESWQQLVLQLESGLRDLGPATDWRTRVLSVHERARALTAKRPDASLYTLVYEAGSSIRNYSCTHALLALMICEQTAAILGWSSEWIDSLGRAALLMNVAMLRRQDLLANSPTPPSAELRREIDAHAEKGAQMLAQAGLGDRLCVEAVRLHHDGNYEAVPLAKLPPPAQLARLLRRVDIFAAKISMRASRAPMSPVQAAREACLGTAGVPDEIGAALLKTVGLYPPGSFVELLSGELGIVIKRGRRANLPYVASLVSASGSTIGEPLMRDTLDRRFGVKAALPPSKVRVLPNHEKLLALIKSGSEFPSLFS